MDWFAKLVVGVLAIATGAIVAASFLAVGGSARDPLGENGLGNPPGMSDRLDFIDTAGAWGRGTCERVVVRAAHPASVVLDDSAGTFPRTGRWLSAETRTAFPFTELLPSWNVSAPPETGLRLEMRVRSARGQRWSPWLYLGSWGRTQPSAPRVTSCRQGAVNVDYLTLDSPADAYQVRVEFVSFSLEKVAAPSLRRIAICYSGVTREKPATAPVEGWARDLNVPFRTQKDAPKSLSGEICSPTSVTMVLAHLGVDRPVVENALAIWDAENDMFGNWGRAVARASELGMDGWLTRFRSWDQVKAQIAAGQPVIASIRFKAGEFPSAALPSTSGHLIVVRGFTPTGDVIVNDPASRERGNGAVYKAEELARAWFDHGGVGYVIRRTTAGTPVASAYSHKGVPMAQVQSYDTPTATNESDGTETQAPSADAFTSTPGQALPKDGAGHWGVAARWFMFAILAIGFVACLYIFFDR